MAINFDKKDITKNEHEQWTIPAETVEASLPEGLTKANVEAVDTWRQEALVGAGETYQTLLEQGGYCPGGEKEDELRPALHVPLMGNVAGKWAVVNNSDPFLSVNTDFGQEVKATREKLKSFLTGSSDE